MTYLKAAQDIIEMYNNYAIACANAGRSCGDHSEAVAIAIEALSIVASLGKDDEICTATTALATVMSR